jgi:hypothetical protein
MGVKTGLKDMKPAPAKPGLAEREIAAPKKTKTRRI